MTALLKVKMQNRRGFTLTELAIVLGVMGTILSAIWVASARVNSSNKAQKAVGQVQMILSGYKAFFGPKGGIDFVGWQDITCLGVNAGFFPQDMLSTVVPCVVTGGVPNNTYPSSPWGVSGGALGGQYVRVLANAPAQNFISMVYGGLSQSACVGLAESIVSTDAVYENISGNFQNINGYMGGGVPFASVNLAAICQPNNTNYVYVSWPVQ